MNLSIAKKINILLLSVILCFGFVVGVVFIKQETKALKAELDDRVKAVLDSLVLSCEYPVMIGDRDSLKKITDAVLSQKDVIDCNIYDKDGKLLSHSGVQEYKGLRRTYNKKMTASKRSSLGFDDILIGPSEKQAQENIGEIFITISFEGQNQKIKDIAKSIFLLIILTAILASLASSLLVKLVLSNPVSDLVAGIQRLSLGDLNFKVKIKTGDEIGKLGAAFNKMTDDLQNVTVSRDYVDNVINTMNDSLLVINADRTLRKVNKALLALLGYEEEELIGKKVMTIFSEDAAIFKDLEWINLLAKGSINDLDLNYVSKAGEKIPVSFSGSVMFDNEGRVANFVGIARDMREVLKLKRQLFQTEKMAAVGQLAGGVAHEINNPMSVILGFAQTVVRRITDENNPLYMPLKSIEREALRCKKLVGDLLTFSRVSKTESEQMDIAMIIDETLSLIESKCRVKDIELRREISADMPRVFGNKNQVQQVIVNLCNNALDAMEKGGMLTLATKVEDKYLKIYVKDTGTGIPQELRERVFEPFFTTKEVGKGTGLGLSISYEIMQKHNGTIEIESEVGKGTNFIIGLPISQQ